MQKALICITSCNRLEEVKKYILPFIDVVNKTDAFHFVLAHDGFAENYKEFCEEFEIPLIYSDAREGVGLSKNRVIQQFPDFDHYFFIDDDVELVNPVIFNQHIVFATQNNFHHLVSTRFFNTVKTENIQGKQINYGLIGGGYFSYFSKKGIELVGGWHTDFAKYRRYGHTEHSCRFVNVGLAKFPFTVLDQCINMLIIHSPEHVTQPDSINYDKEDEIFNGEKDIINQKLKHFDLKTLSQFHFNGFSTSNNKKVDTYLLQNKSIYPLISENRSKVLAEYYFLSIATTNNYLNKCKFFILSFIHKPNNVQIKHWVKSTVFRK